MLVLQMKTNENILLFTDKFRPFRVFSAKNKKISRRSKANLFPFEMAIWNETGAVCEKILLLELNLSYICQLP